MVDQFAEVAIESLQLNLSRSNALVELCEVFGADRGEAGLTVQFRSKDKLGKGLGDRTLAAIDLGEGSIVSQASMTLKVTYLFRRLFIAGNMVRFAWRESWGGLGKGDALESL